ncbi:site-specific DNA-methyltransferase [bacterium]|nr:site-specific DNA-methyltransferase [bacterium]
MSAVEDKSIHLVVTSPPYWQLKDYGHETQIGFHDSYGDYIQSLNLVWQECERVLHPGCRICINIGDQFARAAYYGRYKVIPIRTEIIRFCETIGLDYMGAIIWQKATTVNTTGGAVIMGSFPFPRNGIIKIDYEFILIFKKPGKGPAPSPEAKEASRLTTKEWNQYFYGHWNFPGAKQGEHIAMFPPELPRRLIRMFTFARETVLDPFLGSGTTSLAARETGRDSVGYEKNPEFMDIIREKLGVGESDFVNPFEIEFTDSAPDESDIARRLQTLPPLPETASSLDLRVDPRERTYGSVMKAKKNRTPPE